MLEIALEILKEIESQGFKAYIVGGYPRDCYLNLETVDVDICTSAQPKDLKQIFKEIILPKEQYGSIVLIKNKIRFEITTFRKETKYKDNRHPGKVKYVTDLLADLHRRDFTINTLCIDSNGQMIDLMHAKEDIDKKIIRTVGNPKVKIKEDALRILRAIRFATTLNFKLDKELKRYIKKYASSLKNLSYNRKKEELNKIFSSPNAMVGIKLITELNLDKHLELFNINNVKPTSSLIGFWAQLDANNYNFSNNEKQTIKAIKELSLKGVLTNENLYRYGLYISSIVGEINNIERKEITLKYDQLYIKNRQEIALKAPEICQILNKEPGKFLKVIIDDIENKLVNKKLKNDKQVLTEYILNNYNNN